jgi:uncharacterized protein YeeX (DUF496 family)
MKTIKINGVEFRVTRKTSDTTADLRYGFGVEPSGRAFLVRQIIDATAPGIEVSILGYPDAVEGLLVAPSDPRSLIQRGRTAADDAELGEWRSSASAFDIHSPKELALLTDVSFGELLDRKRRVELRNATGCETLDDVTELIRNLRAEAAENHPLITAIQNAPVVPISDEENAELDEIAKSSRWLTDEEFRASVPVCDQASWQQATGYNTPELAKLRIGQLNRFLDEWQSKSGVASPDELVEKFRAIEDAWKEATGAADTHTAFKKITEMESKLLSYVSEIDVLRKITVPKRDWDAELGFAGSEHKMRVTAERELAKVRAELDSKRRECQTEKERADENAREMVKRGALLDKIAEALGRDFNHDSLPEHVADLKRESDRLDAGKITPEDIAQERKELSEIIASHVRDSGIESAANIIATRYAYLSASWAKTLQCREILLASPGESIVDAAKRVIERWANLEQQIVADDNRTDELRMILYAKEGESVIDAAKRTIEEARAAVSGATQDARNYWSMVVSGWEQCTGCATPEEVRNRINTVECASAALESGIIEARKAAGINHEKPGSGVYTSLAEWCKDALEKLAIAIVPLPKPEKVEAGQKWAFVMTATSGPENESPLLAGRFKNAWGQHYGALNEDLASGFYLGT